MTGLIRDRRAWGLLLLAVLAMTAQPGIILALPGLRQLYGAGGTVMLFIAALPVLVICAPLVGLAVDRKGRWPVLITGLVLYAASGLIGPFLDSYYMVMASVVALNLGVAMIMVAQGALIGDYFAEPGRGRLIGTQIAVLLLGETGLLWVAVKLLAFDPRLPFALATLPLLLIPLLRRLLPAPPDAVRATEPGEAGWPGMVALLVVAAVPSSLIAGMMAVHMPPNLTILVGANEKFTQTFTAGLILTMLVFAVASGWIRPMLGRRWTLIFGHVLVAVGMGLIMVGLKPVMLGAVLIGAPLVGAGLGLSLPAYLTGVLDLAPARFRGLMVGCVAGATALGAGLAPIVMGYYLNRYGHAQLFQLCVTLSAIFAILVLLGFRAQPVDKVTHPD